MGLGCKEGAGVPDTLPHGTAATRKEFVPAVASDETRTGSRKMQNTGKIPDQLVSLDMTIMLVDLVDVRQVEHDASQVLRHRPVQIFLDHNVTAEAIGDS